MTLRAMSCRAFAARNHTGTQVTEFRQYWLIATTEMDDTLFG